MSLANRGGSCPRRTSRAPNSPGASVRSGSTARDALLLQRAREYYEVAWSKGRVTVLDTIMAEQHEQHDVVWQPERVATGRRAMKRGILAYRAAYPDLVFTVLQACCCNSDGTGGSADVEAAGQSGAPGSSTQPAGPQQSQQDSGSSHHEAAGTTTTSDVLPSMSERGAVFVRWHATGTNLGPIREQPPTGKPVSFAGISHLVFNEQDQILQSFVFRQAPEDEKTYFLAQPQQHSAPSEQRAS